MDGTIIKVKSKSKYPKDHNDWVFWHDDLKQTIKEYSKTHSIVIFTNQKGISMSKTSKESITLKIE